MLVFLSYNYVSDHTRPDCTPSHPMMIYVDDYGDDDYGDDDDGDDGDDISDDVIMIFSWVTFSF